MSDHPTFQEGGARYCEEYGCVIYEDPCPYCGGDDDGE